MNLGEITPICGIYEIRNNVNNRIYIGKSVFVQMRWAEHVKELCAGRHHTPLLLRDFQEFGLSAFDAKIIETCLPENLKEREDYWLTETLSDGKSLYNTSFPKGHNSTKEGVKK